MRCCPFITVIMSFILNPDIPTPFILNPDKETNR